jgi:hypothetical protein
MDNEQYLQLCGIAAAHTTLLTDLMVTLFSRLPDPLAELDAYAAGLLTPGARRRTPNPGGDPAEQDLLAQLMEEHVAEMMRKARLGIASVLARTSRPPP